MARGPNEVFVDTSGWYAVTRVDDPGHRLAAAYYSNLSNGRTRFLTSDYILDETLTRLRYDMGHTVALAFWQHIQQAVLLGLLRVIRIDERIWSDALAIFRTFEDQDFSFTDCTSFALARDQNIGEIFTFDHHFLTMGFIIQPVP
ncbi:MAG: PIN domain-containing protein [Armatimonadota bacterium]|nr:PIN domain-containing protein [Armatimonadota bacterium]